MARTLKPRSRVLSPSDWENLPDEELLPLRVRDLGLKIEDSPLQACVNQLYEELSARGLSFRPPCFLADEWFCPDKVPIIGIPFCLSHPRLKQIEQRKMYEVEGGVDASCMRLLRHECGHAINYAYDLYKRTRWRELFGAFSAHYSTIYHFQPYSRHYVMHLEDNYAQAHPDEDFAETFAVWLTPGSDWENKYAHWPVISKLRYVDNLMRRIGEKTPTNTQRQTPYSASRMTSTLEAYYARKRKYMGEDFPGYYDDSLKVVFSEARESAGATRAARVLRKFRKQIVKGVTAWTRHRKYDIHHLVRRLVRRCDALGLYTRSGEAETVIEVTALVCAIVDRALTPEALKGQQ
ncbi:MAG: hypothetical protein O2901_08715 [Verrucomicrobia bacterium]|nr:hypothetical protein [Verrucomicrobiota bacterium]